MEALPPDCGAPAPPSCARRPRRRYQALRGIVRLVAVRPRSGMPGGGADDARIIARMLSSGAAPISLASSMWHCTAGLPIRKVQAVTGIRVSGVTSPPRCAGRTRPFAHGVWLDNDDMARLGDHGASVAHNPGSNMRLAAPSSGDARAAGQSRHRHRWHYYDNQNMYEAMRLASFASKVRWRQPKAAPRRSLPPRIGRIAHKADIVMLDLDHPNWLPLEQPGPPPLVSTEAGSAITSVMIGGRMIVVTGGTVECPVWFSASKPRARAACDRECRQPPPGQRSSHNGCDRT